MQFFDADVKKATTRHQCENCFNVVQQAQELRKRQAMTELLQIRVATQSFHVTAKTSHLTLT